MTSVLGIFRAACYSPGMVERDEAILRAVAERLQRVGYVVRLVREEDFTTDIPIPDIVLHMVRSPRVLDILQSWQEAGCRVINSVEGVRGVERAALAEMCAAQGIPTPKTWIVGTANSKLLTARTTDGEDVPISFPCWVKRTGSCAQAPDDVSRVDDAEGYVQCLSRFHARHIDRVVVMEHLEGVGLKFYAIPDVGFFYSLPSTSLGYDKFSKGMLNHVADDTMCCGESVSSQLSVFNFPLEIYGGDAIIGSDGVARLIDLNDWPSFSVCRDVAADAIVHLVMHINK